MLGRSVVFRSAAVIAAALAGAACGEGATSESSRAPASSSVPPASAAPSSAVLDPATACEGNELPAVGAVDLASGEVSWLACSSEEVWRSVVGATDEAVLIDEAGDAPTSSTVGFSAGDGTELWRRPAARYGTLPRGPVAGAGVVVRESDSGSGVVGLDVLTGNEIWRLDGQIQPLGGDDTIVVVADSAPVDGGPPGIRGLDRATGTEVWSSDVSFGDMSGVGVARGPAAVWDGMIAVPTGDTLTAVDIASGATLWTAPQTDHPEAAEGVVVGAVPGSGPGRSIRALDAVTGETLWEAPGQSSYGDLLAIGDGIVVALDEGGEIVAYELRTGAERWRRDALGQPQLVAGTTLVSLWEGTLAASSTTDGSTIWSAEEPLGSSLMNSVGVGGSSLYVAVNSRPWGD